MRRELFVQDIANARIEDIARLNPTGVMLRHDSVTSTTVEDCKAQGWSVGIVVDASFDQSRCPGAGPQQSEIERIVSLGSNTIWLDHLLFPGKWDYRTLAYDESHDECSHCRGLERRHVVEALAKRWRAAFSGELGYFAIALGIADSRATESTGQQHTLLAPHFDVISPMLYNRRDGRPSSFIDSYAKQLANDLDKPILPMVQIRDLPEDLEDLMTLGDILDTTMRAARKPSSGVAWFAWEHASADEKTRRALTTAGRLLNSS